MVTVYLISTYKTAFCGPCFGAGDTPANNTFSIRHTTRNFPNREGSKPGNGQFASVALMDAKSIAATAINGGILTSAEAYADAYEIPPYDFDDSAYKARVYNGFGKGDDRTSRIGLKWNLFKTISSSRCARKSWMLLLRQTN